MDSKIKETLEMCYKFTKDETRNPKTNRKIKKNGPTYKKLWKQCEKAVKIEQKRRKEKKEREEKKGRRKKTPKKFIKKDVRKNIKKKIKQLPAAPKSYIQRVEKRSDCNDWKKNPLKNPKTNRKIKLNGPTYKKFQKMCKGDSKVKESMKLIKTSVRKITNVYKEWSPDLIIKKATKRVKDKNIKLESGTKLTETIMILYLLKKHKGTFNMLLREDFIKLFSKLNTNQLTTKDFRSLDYLTMVEVDNKTNKPIRIDFPYTDEGMDQYFWDANNPKHPNSKNRFTFLLMSLFSKPIMSTKINKVLKEAWGHMNFMVYDKKENKVYRFEPNGGVVNFYDSPTLDKMLAKKFEKWGVKYQTMNDFCFMGPKGKTLGPQALEERTEEQKTDPGGFCAYWSIFFIDFIMTNHKREVFKDDTIQDYLDEMINDIHNKFVSYKSFIRTFAVFINNASRNIGKNKDIDAYIDKMIKQI